MWVNLNISTLWIKPLEVRRRKQSCVRAGIAEEAVSQHLGELHMMWPHLQEVEDLHDCALLCMDTYGATAQEILASENPRFRIAVTSLAWSKGRGLQNVLQGNLLNMGGGQIRQNLKMFIKLGYEGMDTHYIFLFSFLCLKYFTCTQIKISTWRYHKSSKERETVWPLESEAWVCPLCFFGLWPSAHGFTSLSLWSHL